MPSPVASSLRSVIDQIIQQRAESIQIQSTYRIQFHKEFTFANAMELVPYFASLGVSHLYASPIFKASPGSMHGYDVVDYSQINPEIGTRDELEELVRVLREHKMGLVIDHVPNHMGIEKGANPWWQDVLENGRMSRYADHFDIDWQPIKRELRNKVLLPFLGGQYGEILERGELKLGYQGGRLTANYWDTPFPLDPRTYPVCLRTVQASLSEEDDAEDIDALELESIINALDRLPAANDHDLSAEEIDARHREQVVTLRRLSDLVERNADVSNALEEAVARLNGEVGNPESFDDLDALLSQQPWRLSYWRVASEEINYRRFFAINTLAAIRQEDSAVFEEAHALLLDLLVDGTIDGVRFDHTDGLWDPERYFNDLQVGFLRAAVRKRLQPESDDDWEKLLPDLNREIRAALQEIAEGDRNWPVWTVAEKILEHGEPLPRSWKIAGTVGYEFMQSATGVLVNPQSRAMFDTIYQRYTGERIRYNELVYDMKLAQVREAFASELNVLTNVANRISESDRHSRDFTFNSLRAALREVIACFSVYRTYTTCGEPEVTEHDRETINLAVNEAIRRNPRLDSSVFEFIRQALLLHHTGEIEERRYAPCHFAMKLQQLSGPVMAKGLEDTTFFRFNRLTSLNEVGGDPAQFGTSVGDFHRQNQARLNDWPHSMINSSTHDTKRSEDVRAAISVLSERPTEWRAGINRWTRLNRRFKVKIDGALAPHRVDEWVLYQTLIGTWPLDGFAGLDEAYVTRMQDYMLKVVREAGRFSNWVNPNADYETALRDFVKGILNKRRARAFLKDIDQFIAQQRDATLANALSQQVMKLTSPGVPDIYQGTELWDDSLVDPDNRRPVNYQIRQTYLEASNSVSDLVKNRAGGGIKLELTAALLRLRRENAGLFLRGEYAPVRVSGEASEHVIAYAREFEGRALLVILPRLLYLASEGGEVFGNPDIWTNTTLHLPASLSSEGWSNLFTGAGVADASDLTSLFAEMPFAVLIHSGDLHK